MRVRVSDAEATTTSTATTLTITNAAPSASFTNSGDVVEGEDASVSFSDLADPSAADSAAGLRYAYDFDGQYTVGDSTYAGAVTSATVAVPAALLADGPKTVQRQRRGLRQGRRHAQLRDHDRGRQRGAVRDLHRRHRGRGHARDGPLQRRRTTRPPPTREAGLTYEYDLDGDGTFEPGGASATVPATDGPAMLQIRGAIVDRDGGRTEYTATVVVTNAAPTASIAGPQTVPSSGVVALTLTAGDPSPSDQLTGVLDWGDGHTETIAGRGEHAVGHTYAAAGDYTVTYEVSEVVEGDRARAEGERATARHKLSVASLPAPRVKPEPTPDPTPTPAPTTGRRRPRAGSPGVTVDAAAADQRPRGHAALRPRARNCAPRSPACAR